MAIFPSAVSTDSDLYIAKNGLATILSSSIDNVVTTVPVTSTTGFPTVGYIVIDSEVIKYTSTDATHFLSCTRASDGTSNVSHNSGASVRASAVANHHNALKDEIKAIEQNISDRLGLSATQVLALVGSAAAPAIAIGQANNGLYRGASNSIVVSCGGTATIQFDQAQLYTLVPITMATGSATAPGYTFYGDTDTGIYSPGANQIGFAANGALIAYFSGVGALAVGDGTVSNPAFRFINDLDTGAFLNGVGFLGFAVGGSMAFQARANGLEMGSGKIAQFDDGTQAAPSICFSSNAAVGLYKNSANQFSAVINNTVVQTWSASQGAMILGTTAGNSANTGFVGEYIESYVSAVNFPATSVWGDATSLSLSAGDWDVTVMNYYTKGGATVTSWRAGISTTSGNSTTGMLLGENHVIRSTTPPDGDSLPIANYRLSSNAAFTVYAKFRADYTVATPTCNVFICARRVR
jgi:hypothetical protein